MKKEICFDMDGTIADLYGVEGWLEDLEHFSPRPYEMARPMIRMNQLARKLNQLQRKGYTIKVISWLSKANNKAYDELVIEAKLAWLNIHLHSVQFDEIVIIPYGTPKSWFGDGILFDDEERNRKEWNGFAYEPSEIIEVLNSLL